MKEKLYTIPLIEAFEQPDECPFCFIARKLEQDALDFVLGAAATYMESDMREQTDETGFCREHNKKMYDYGNTLGNALILHTYYKKLNQQLIKIVPEHSDSKSMASFFDLFKKNQKNVDCTTPIAAFIRKKEASCYICDRINTTYDRYLHTFFYLVKNQVEFMDLLKQSKGLCLHHFADVNESAQKHLDSSTLGSLNQVLNPLMLANMKRIEEDLSWLIDKFDYRNADAPWKNSQDAVPRAMQKLKGSYPSDSAYQNDK